MTSFLISKKNKVSYNDKLSEAPESTRRNKMLAVKTFESFCAEKYQKSSTEIIDEIIRIKKIESEEYEDALYGILQEWINWNKKRGWSSTKIAYPSFSLVESNPNLHYNQII